MRDALIICGGLAETGARHGEVIELDVARDAPHSRRIAFDTGRLCQPLLDDLPDVLADALEIAAYVFCADRLVCRGGSGASSGIGSEWQRKLLFRIPVRRPDIWGRTDVTSLLVETLSFLSGDRFSFDFHAAVEPMSLEPFLGFGDRNAQTIRPDQVMLFSGGLDSLAGVARDVVGSGKCAVLVTHQSAKAIIDLQNQLAETIGSRLPPKQTFYLPVRLYRGAEQPKEHSQRLRSFLFATLGMAYARMFGLSSVTFFENGITSFNLPVVAHVIGTRASRTTHPQVLALYGKLFSLVLGDKVTFINPFMWKTKADIVKLIMDHGLGDQIRLTTSCASVRAYSMTRRQCGVCSQCVERRVAMITAGAEDLEDAYATDIFLGPVEGPTALTMVGGHLLRARRLSTMSQFAFFSNHGQVFRALQALEGTTSASAERTYELHRRYGREFVDVVEQRMVRQATIEGMRAIAPQSMLAMLQCRSTEARAYTDALEGQQNEVVTARTSEKRLTVRTIAFAVNAKAKRIEFTDGPVLGGATFRILEKLVSHNDEQPADSVPEDRPYMSAKRLAELLQTDQPKLRTQISRLRKSLADRYEKCTGYSLDQDDVIQNRSWHGYRLNPYVLVIPAEKVQVRPKVSRLAAKPVTTQPRSS